MCDSLVAAAPHTLDGSMLFAKNSDRHQDECQPFQQYPAAVHPRGAMLECTYITITQVAETYRVMGHSPWWAWGFEHGVNEHGVAIGNQALSSREPVEAEPGLIGMDLVRLGLERGRDARESVEVMAALIEAYGQGGAGLGPDEGGYHNGFLVADPESAYLMETSRRHWAVRRVDLASASDHISMGSDWDFASRNLESFARSAGWWSGGERLDVAAAYRDPHAPGVISEGRHRRCHALLERGRGKHDPRTMMRILRDHGGDDLLPPIDIARDRAPHCTICMHAEPVGTTTASMVAPLPVDRSGPWPVWIAFGSPCTGIFIPVYLAGVLPASMARGGDDGPAGDPGSLWWRQRRLQAAVSVDVAARLPVVQDTWAALDRRIEGERVLAEREARNLSVAGEHVEAASTLSAFMSRSASQVMEAADDLIRQLRG